MRIIIALLFALGIGNMYAQEKNTVTNDSNSPDYLYWDLSCENGTKEAKADFKKGKYNCYSYGMIIYKDYEFYKFFEQYLKKTYKINTDNKGCVVSDYSECYSKTMTALVKEKFGKDIFTRAKKEAKKLYANHTPKKN
ncbi:hypothetical protein [Kordia sp.]|uniref:hypothetical protein n=1 Tax=Kordia sp. TaxID=1965332 RepID=UPI003D6A7546